MPNPFPNELLLIFTGYLSYKGVLFLPLVILTALSADFIGTNILYVLFYNTGSFIMQKRPKWLPLSARMIERLTSKISRGGQLSIYIFRLTPFTRGYTSVITGLLLVKPKVFIPIALISALTWSTVYVVIGHLIGPSWHLISQNISGFKFIMLAFITIILLMALVVYFNGKRRKHKKNAIINNS